MVFAQLMDSSVIEIFLNKYLFIYTTGRKKVMMTKTKIEKTIKWRWWRRWRSRFSVMTVVVMMSRQRRQINVHFAVPGGNHIWNECAGFHDVEVCIGTALELALGLRDSIRSPFLYFLSLPSVCLSLPVWPSVRHFLLLDRNQRSLTSGGHFAQIDRDKTHQEKPARSFLSNFGFFNYRFLCMHILVCLWWCLTELQTICNSNGL